MNYNDFLRPGMHSTLDVNGLDWTGLCAKKIKNWTDNIGYKKLKTDWNNWYMWNKTKTKMEKQFSSSLVSVPTLSIYKKTKNTSRHVNKKKMIYTVANLLYLELKNKNCN